jgi:hypothetical protein
VRVRTRKFGGYMKGRGRTRSGKTRLFKWPSASTEVLRARLPLVWTGESRSSTAFRVGTAVYRGLALNHYCFALVRPALEGGYCGFGEEVWRGLRIRRLTAKPATEDRLIGFVPFSRPCRSLWMFGRWLTLS